MATIAFNQTFAKTLKGRDIKVYYCLEPDASSPVPKPNLQELKGYTCEEKWEMILDIDPDEVLQHAWSLQLESGLMFTVVEGEELIIKD